jgi:hypothetical protein
VPRRTRSQGSPDEIEDYRDERWRREETRRVETALDAEWFIEDVGSAACLTDWAGGALCLGGRGGGAALPNAARHV